ncbi:pyridoxamine 5'-phosphate oxidase family protein [bacterium]|nr:pyridoxamine 5'-phosphate oxidase family protein [bacterium]
MSTLAMSPAQRDEFLAATHVGVVSIADGARGPLAVPVWYRYAPGGTLRFVTGARSRKAALLRAAGRAGFCVQSESPPYQYVSIEGPVTLGAPDYETDVRQVALRYLGEAMGEIYLATSAQNPEPTVLVELRPERWYSVDYSRLGLVP